MGHISNGPIRWEETHPSTMKAFTAIIIKIEDTQPKTAKLYEIIWIS